MNAKLALKTSSVIENILSIDSFQDMITIAHVDVAKTKDYLGNSMQTMAIDKNSFLLILVKKGYAQFSLDYKTYSIGSNKLTFIIPDHTFSITDMSDDLKAKILLIDQLFQEEMTKDKKGFYNYISLKRNPITRLEQEEHANLEKALLLLQEKTRMRTHLFQKEIVYNATTGLFLDVQNILARKNDGLVYPILSRKEEVVNKFLNLLSTYGKQQHSLSFYGDKLFITPQYLSAILKEYTGKSGSKWINEALILEAKKLIKSPFSSIQDVAYTLNFSDQSTFGKFFKKSLGISPLGYRRM